MTPVDLVSQSTVLFMTLFVMMLGLVFTIVPPIPGTLIIWAGAIFYGWALGWEKLGWLTLSFLTLLMIVGIIADVLAGHFGAKVGGASCFSVAVGAVAGFGLGIAVTLTGIPFIGCIGGLVGTLGGILLAERWRRGEWQSALRATKGYLAGASLGIMAKVTSGLLMLGAFLTRVYLWP
jgi:uncharacterized protein YqgC (DUF456 family)